MGHHADAEIAWSIDLGNSEERPDYAKAFDPDAISTWVRADNYVFKDSPELGEILDIASYGYEFDGQYICLKRSHTKVYEYGSKQVDPDSIKPPTEEEVTALLKAAVLLGMEPQQVDIQLRIYATYG